MKIINCLANPEDKIYENEEIKLLLSALNITPNRYDPKKLRYGRVAICVDGDSDGGHIALLIMSALYYLCPEFLRENRLCWLRAPLYIVKNGKKETYFYSDKDFESYNGKGEVSRAKGLGSLSAEQAEASMFGEKQIMEVLKPDEDSLNFLHDLMGSDIEARREFVFNKIDFSSVRE